MSAIKVDCEKVLGGDAGPPRQRRVVLHARGRDERRRRVEEGRVPARPDQFAEKKVQKVVGVVYQFPTIIMCQLASSLGFCPMWLSA